MKRTKIAYLAFLAVLMLPIATFAGPINVDFGGHHCSPVSPSFGGVSGQTGIWNNVTSFGATAIVDVNRNGAGILNLSTSGGSSSGTTNHCGTDIQNLVNDNFYAENAGHSWSIVITGLVDGLYDLVYYAPSHTAVDTGAFLVNGLTALNVLNNENDTTVLAAGVNYGTLSDIMVSGGIMTFSSEVGFMRDQGLSGFQLVNVSAIPEPGTLALMGLGLAGMGLARRRRNV